MIEAAVAVVVNVVKNEEMDLTRRDFAGVFAYCGCGQALARAHSLLTYTLTQQLCHSFPVLPCQALPDTHDYFKT